MKITVTAREENAVSERSEPRLRSEGLGVAYGAKVAVRDVSIDVADRSVAAIIGPSGSGKSTVLRCFNRMNDLIPSARVSGSVMLDDEELNDPQLNVVELRRRVGLVFQKPNPFPMSIFENSAYGPRRLGIKDHKRLAEIDQASLGPAAIWDEVKEAREEPPGTAVSRSEE